MSLSKELKSNRQGMFGEVIEHLNIWSHIGSIAVASEYHKVVSA